MLCLQLPVGQMFLLLQGTCFLRGQLGCAAAIEHLPASHGLVVLGRTCLLTALQGWHMTQCKLQHVCSHSLLSFSLFNVNSFECAWAIFVSCTSPGRWDIRDDCAAVWAVFFQKPWTKAVDDLVWLHRDVGRPCNKLFLQFRCLSERNGCGGQLWLLWFWGTQPVLPGFCCTCPIAWGCCLPADVRFWTEEAAGKSWPAFSVCSNAVWEGTSALRGM